MYSAVNQKECATARAALLVNKMLRMRSCNWVTEVIINIRLRVGKGYFTITGNYAPGEAKIETLEVPYFTKNCRPIYHQTMEQITSLELEILMVK
jgi:hypothetical protein